MLHLIFCLSLYIRLCPLTHSHIFLQLFTKYLWTSGNMVQNFGWHLRGMEFRLFHQFSEALQETATKGLGRSLAGFDMFMSVLVNRKLFSQFYDLIRQDVNFFVRVSAQSFVIINFSTDVFTNNTSSIVVAIIKLVSVTIFQVCTIVASIYIRY